MNEPQSIPGNVIYYRLIALWILCEAMLGGIIHAAKIPVSGLIVGSCAVVCLCLIAFYQPARGAIIRATMIVAIFKMVLSPQAPPLAYFAVFFQGLMGELLFYPKGLIQRNKKFFRLSCLLLGLIALLESGLQRIIVLTVVYGNNFWKAINDFINELTKQKSFTNYSLIIGLGYVFIHIVVGLLAGWWSGMIPQKVFSWKQQLFEIPGETNAKEILPAQNKKKRKWLKKGVFAIWIILLLLYFQSYFKMGKPVLPQGLALQIFIRSVIIVLTWYFVIGPLISYLLKKWLQKKQLQSKETIQQIAQLLPELQRSIAESWQRTKGKKGIKKIILVAKNIFVNVLVTRPDKTIYLLNGPIQSGKTTRLMQWSAGKKNVFGILTPVVEGKRVFMDVHTKEQFKMEAEPGEENVFTIGKFVFIRNAFEKAVRIIENAIENKNSWIIIDEIGPLELQGKGFSAILEKVLADQTNFKLLIVVRDGLVNQVIDRFKIAGDKISILKPGSAFFD